MNQQNKLADSSPCSVCGGCHWVCENHPTIPWDGEKACGCGGAGEPCPRCNKVDRGNPPKMPDGFRTVRDKENGWRN